MSIIFLDTYADTCKNEPQRITARYFFGASDFLLRIGMWNASTDWDEVSSARVVGRNRNEISTRNGCRDTP